MGKLFGWLNRGYAETIEAYNTRMNRLPVLHAGYVFFDWVNYDAATHSFSVYIEWNGELNRKLQDAMPQGGYAFRCSEEQAVCYTKEHNGSPVYIKLHAKCGRLYIKHMYFNSADKRYELFYNGCEVIPPEMVCFWGRGPVEKMDYSSFLPQEPDQDTVRGQGETQRGSYRRLRSSFHGSYRGLRGSYRVGSYRSLLGSYRGIGGSYRNLLGSYRGIGGSYRSLSGSYRGIGSSYRSLLGSYRGIGGSYRSLSGSYRGIGGSYRSLFGSYYGIGGSYRSLSGSYRGIGGSYRGLFGSYYGIGGSYRNLLGSYRSIGGSYRSLSGSYRGIGGSYRGLSGSYRGIGGSYRSLSGSYRGQGGSYRGLSGSRWDLADGYGRLPEDDGEFGYYAVNEMDIYFTEEDNMVDGTLGYGLDLIW